MIKRETLIKNLKTAVDRIEHTDLPVTVKEIHAYGGILRDKEKLHDLDLLVVYDQTPEQTERWERFRKNFSNVSKDETREITAVELDAVLRPLYLERKLSLPKALSDEKLAKRLSSVGIESLWAACFSWSDFYQAPLMGIFFPDLDKVMGKLFLKGTRGLQVFYIEYDKFKKDGPSLTAKNFKLAWSPENPYIEKNLESDDKEKKDHIISELEHFKEQIKEYKQEFDRAKKEVLENAKKAGIKISFKTLESKYIAINYGSGDSYPDLQKKCETARNQMRDYIREKLVLDTLAYNIEREHENEHNPKTSVDSRAAYWTILAVGKREVSEKKIREVLRDLGLPEDHTVTVKTYSPYGNKTRTDYRHEPDDEKRKILVKEAEEEKIRGKYIEPLRKIILAVDKDYSIYVKLEDKKPKQLYITFSRWTKNEKLGEQFTKNGFQVESDGDYIQAYKSIDLEGSEDMKELKELARGAVMTTSNIWEKDDNKGNRTGFWKFDKEG